MSKAGVQNAAEPAAADQRADDQRLVLALADGDGAALGELFSRHAGALLALARRMVGSEADDLVHDVFVEAWRHAAAYDPARASVRTWLLVRCRSRALDRLRSAKARGAVLQAGVALGTPPEAASAAASIDGARAWGLLLSLPSPQRAVIELAYFGGLSASEIAASLGVPVGTVKSRTAAALRALRGLLGESRGEGA